LVVNSEAKPCACLKIPVGLFSVVEPFMYLSDLLQYKNYIIFQGK